MRPSFSVVVVVLFAVSVTRLVPAQDSVEKNLAEALLAAQKQQPSEEAVQLLTRAIEQQPERAIGYYHRGRENFRLGRIKESVADFDKYVKLEPALESRQWERGISQFYAEQYAAGAKQFELYQTYHDQDVENSAWRYLCLVPTEGVAKAQATMLPIERDSRVPMMQIYDLYRGQAKPEDVLAATEKLTGEAKNTAEFYAHLYLGLWYDVAGNKAQARKHLFAAEARPIGHYMYDVARIHAQKLRTQQEAEAKQREPANSSASP